MSKINLRNYTTEVAATKSIGAIEKLLVQFGATNIMKQYRDGTCIGISFIVKTQNMHIPFRLPANISGIHKWMRKKYERAKEETLLAKAERIAWKLMYEWIHMQLSLIEIEQAELLEVMLPYVYDVPNDKTYYQKLKGEGFKALLPSSNT